MPTNEQHRFGLGLEYRRQVVEVFDPPHKATPPIHRRTHARTHARTAGALRSPRRGRTLAAGVSIRPCMHGCTHACGRADGRARLCDRPTGRPHDPPIPITRHRPSYAPTDHREALAATVPSRVCTHVYTRVVYIGRARSPPRQRTRTSSFVHANSEPPGGVLHVMLHGMVYAVQHGMLQAIMHGVLACCNGMVHGMKDGMLHGMMHGEMVSIMACCTVCSVCCTLCCTLCCT